VALSREKLIDVSFSDERAIAFATLRGTKKM